ncbi:MAG: translation initiation factor IF-2 subunit beta [Candidatus Hydrothermarchaeota archaeon]|nr:MAG: translation initiation factor IF-2 subunit beta [Candidatus Hydrothermarchaeota archaeon]
MEYEKLLEKAYNELPETLKTHERFVIPQIISHIQGKITIVQNLGEIAKLINRNPDMLAKYLIKELGTAGSHDSQHLILKGQFRNYQIQQKFEDFLREYVLCPECGRPDTKIIQEKRVHILKCEACGSWHPLGSIKTKTVSKPDKPKVGDVVTLQVTQTGRKGDGMARMGEYVIFINGAREGQTVKAKITGIQGNTIFAEIIELIK